VQRCSSLIGAIIPPLATPREGGAVGRQAHEFMKDYAQAQAVLPVTHNFDQMKDDLLSAIQGVFRLMP
jgi:hypothetical protein